MSSFKSRAITSLFFVVVMIGSIIWGPYIFALVFLAVSIFALIEFYRHLKVMDIRPFFYPGLIVGGCIYCLVALTANLFIPIRMFVIIIPLLFVIFIIALFRFSNSAFTNAVYTVFGIVYIILPFSMLNLFFNPHFIASVENVELLLGYFFVLWGYDTAAYLIGAKFGKHQFVGKISPKKTWEGILGGLIFGLATAVAVFYIFKIYSLLDWLLIGLIVIVTGTLGDLFESLFKRNIGVKDTGNILPGHGGVLDRFDAVLLSAPFVYLYVFLLK